MVFLNRMLKPYAPSVFILSNQCRTAIGVFDVHTFAAMCLDLCEWQMI